MTTWADVLPPDQPDYAGDVLEPELLPDLEPDQPGAALLLEPVTEDEARRFLDGLGRGLSITVGSPAVEDHWKFTPDELDLAAPALAAIANRRQTLARAIRSSDWLTVAVVMGGYTKRNVQAAALAVLEEPADHGNLAREAGNDSTAAHARAADAASWAEPPPTAGAGFAAPPLSAT